MKTEEKNNQRHLSCEVQLKQLQVETHEDYNNVGPPIISPPHEDMTQSHTSALNQKSLEANTSHRPPPPPKTAFMCFSMASNNTKSTTKGTGNSNLKEVASQWRLLSPNEKAFWEEKARQDRLRYVRAKTDFIPTPDSLPKRRAKKHPLAPKRPMSAFLKFSLTRRKSVKADNPDMNNTDISRLLGEMWRNACDGVKRPYVETELQERAVYKAEIARWRMIQKRKEMDEALNETTRDTSEELCSKVSEDSSRVCASSEDSCSSYNEKSHKAYTHSKRVLLSESNDLVESGNYNHLPVLERRETIRHQPYNNEPINTYHHHQDMQYNNGANDLVENAHHTYYSSTERASGNHGMEYYQNTIDQPFSRRTHDEDSRHRFNERPVTTPYDQQHREQSYYRQHYGEDQPLSWDTHYNNHYH